MSFNPKYTVTAQMLKNLGRIELVKQSFESQPLSPQLLHSLRETAKVSSVHYSTYIEGNKLTFILWSKAKAKRFLIGIAKMRFMIVKQEQRFNSSTTFLFV